VKRSNDAKTQRRDNLITNDPMTNDPDEIAHISQGEPMTLLK